MNLRRLTTLVLFFVCIGALAQEKFSTAISTRAESPVDGSLWIGTTNQGIFRFGKNGRKLWYSKESGHLASNSILTLAFDNQKTLWILDADGHVTKYTSVGGFEQELSIPEGVTAFCFSPDGASLYFATRNSQLFSYDLSSGGVSEPVTLPCIVSSLLPSVEDSSIWAISDSGMFRISSSGGLITWNGEFSASNLLPFKFDTTTPTDIPDPFNKAVLILVLVVVALSIALASVLYRNLLFSCANKRKSAVPVDAVVEVTKPNSAVGSQQSVPSGTLSDTLDTSDTIPILEEPGEFTLKVRALIQDHYSDPDFGAEKIAEISGLSRIHVNRKLKAEGAPSPSVMLKETRMSLAAQLLKEGNLTISQIGSQCGFARPSYFATAFKEYFGVSPSEFISKG